jgi:CTP-dependent riboflavin kinase
MSEPIRGVVREGKGEGKTFTQLDWVREQFRLKVGFDPYPGTLNVQTSQRDQLAEWRTRQGIQIEPRPGYCAAVVLRVRVNGRIDAAWIIPFVPNYPTDVLELMAGVSLRETLGLVTGNQVSIELLEGAE